MTNLFNLEYPIIQAPMAGGITTPEFIATISNNGCLGFVAGGYLSISELRAFIVSVQSNLQAATTPFGVNIFIEQGRSQQQILYKSPIIKEIEHTQFNISDADTFIFPASIPEHEYIDLLIELAVPIVSCTFGFLSHDSVTRLKQHNIKIIANTTTLDEFVFCVKGGADAVLIQGTEAGGHQASFLDDKQNTQSTHSLLKEIRNFDLDTPIIVAGGISLHNYHEYLLSGANFVQLGTAFMMTHESNVILAAKEFISKSRQTALSDKITGKWARGIENALLRQLDNDLDYNFPEKHYMSSQLRQSAKRTLNPEYMSLWAGSNLDNLQIRHLDDLINALKLAYQLVEQL